MTEDDVVKELRAHEMIDVVAPLIEQVSTLKIQGSFVNFIKYLPMQLDFVQVGMR